MFNFSKSYLVVAAAIFMAVASYFIAWQNIKSQKFTAKQIEENIQVQVKDPVKNLIQKTSEAILVEPLTQLEVSTTVEAVTVSNLPKLENLPTWQKNSRQKPLEEGKFYIAIVIDDVGVVGDRSLRSVDELPKEITLAFLPYGDATTDLIQRAYDKGHEIMIHLPMEAHEAESGYKADPGPHALYTNYELEKVKSLTDANMKDIWQMAVGVNNHMGSKFTEWKEGMEVVLQQVSEHELLFLDSLTTSNSVVDEIKPYFPHTPILKRNVFLDHVIEQDKIMQALEKTERIAKANGYAIAIGHPHEETTNALVSWVKTLNDKNIQLVPITALIKE